MQTRGVRMDEAARRNLATVFTGVSHPTRIAVLETLEGDGSLTALADKLEVTRGTLQDHIEQLIQAELVYRPSEEGRTYATTPLGNEILRLLEANSDTITGILALLEREEETVRDEIGPALEVLDEVDEATWERTIHTRTWERALEDAQKLLEG